MNHNMNLGSIEKLVEETWVFGTQPRQTYKLVGSCQPGAHLCNSNLPSQSFNTYSSHYPYLHMNYSSDWEICEAVRFQELEEIKARAAQMEKTMHWWSDCTANWREKWSKVRTERNKAQEEARQLRIKLDDVVKELSMLKKVNQDLVSKKENLESVTAWRTEFSCSELSYIKKDLIQIALLGQEPVKELSKTNVIPVAEDTKKDAEVIKKQRNQNKKITPKPHDSFPEGVPSIDLEEPKKKLDNTAKTTENDLIHVSFLHLHLAEMQKILQKEREMNLFLEKEMEQIENELFIWKWKYEELRRIKLESVKQLERLQFENTSERGKGEKLEAEKQSLEEENRRLELQVKEIQGLLEMKNKTVLAKSSCYHQNAQSKLLFKNKSEEPEESKLRIWDLAKFFVCCWSFYQNSE
ncbi:PREDICTED: coiled-coil domain-containing protein 102B [Chaetura pelagica]|uniref:coiled-coil domain-containing protein 102B n=1 Tax=Chaetura pelagica TaxID=8897 RepID=UPI000523446E|nr:PREDICTED: coiled-coil domain-containing protein 102B [Chaetura pelagica]